jgi:hypothetical protein
MFSHPNPKTLIANCIVWMDIPSVCFADYHEKDLVLAAASVFNLAGRNVELTENQFAKTIRTNISAVIKPAPKQMTEEPRTELVFRHSPEKKFSPMYYYNLLKARTLKLGIKDAICYISWILKVTRATRSAMLWYKRCLKQGLTKSMATPTQDIRNARIPPSIIATIWTRRGRAGSQALSIAYRHRNRRFASYCGDN